jgi:hypothetical protein
VRFFCYRIDPLAWGKETKRNAGDAAAGRSSRKVGRAEWLARARARFVIQWYRTPTPPSTTQTTHNSHPAPSTTTTRLQFLFSLLFFFFLLTTIISFFSRIRPFFRFIYFFPSTSLSTPTHPSRSLFVPHPPFSMKILAEPFLFCFGLVFGWWRMIMWNTVLCHV